MQRKGISPVRVVMIATATKVEITRILLSDSGVRVVKEKTIVKVRKGSSAELALAGQTLGWQTGTHE